MADSEIDAEMARVEAELADVAKEFILEAIANLREETPVDTGHARANWVASSGSPFGEVDGVQTRTSELHGRVLHGATTAGGAAAAGDEAVLGYKLIEGDLWIANNVPYITGPGSLNDGHSDQAPRLFIEAAIYKAGQDVGARRDFQFEMEFAG